MFLSGGTGHSTRRASLVILAAAAGVKPLLQCIVGG
jgi:hypothetical protein